MPERRPARKPHPDPSVEAVLLTAEAMGLMVTYHPCGFARSDAEVGYTLIVCPRGCPKHNRVRINHQDWTFIERQAFLSWIGTVMTDHDQRDVAGSE